MRTLIGKEWNPECWNEDEWEDPDESGNIEPLNSNESSLPMKEVYLPPERAASPSLAEGVNRTLSGETVVNSPEAVVFQDNADSPQDPPPPLYVSRPLTGLKCQQASQGEAQSVTHEEVH